MSNLKYFHRDWIEPTTEIIETDVCIYGGSSGVSLQPSQSHGPGYVSSSSSRANTSVA